MKRFLCGWVALGLLVGGAGPAKADYIFTTLDVPGSFLTLASGINNSGQIVGYYDEGVHGFLWSGGRFSTLDVPGFARTFATGINESGQIVGWSTNIIISLGGVHLGLPHGFLRNGGGYTTLDVPGSAQTVLQGINNASQIVGGYDNHGFSLSGNSYTRVDVPGSIQTLANGINNAGQIVGVYSDRGRNHAFLLSSGSYTTIDVPGRETRAYGINDAGQIVGSYYDGGTNHGFLLDKDSYATLDVPGSITTRIFGINDAGQIVGDYSDARGQHGFLATPAGAPVPEPSTLLLLGIGTLGVIGWAWRGKAEILGLS